MFIHSADSFQECLLCTRYFCKHQDIAMSKAKSLSYLVSLHNNQTSMSDSVKCYREKELVVNCYIVLSSLGIPSACHREYLIRWNFNGDLKKEREQKKPVLTVACKALMVWFPVTLSSFHTYLLLLTKFQLYWSPSFSLNTPVMLQHETFALLVS